MPFRARLSPASIPRRRLAAVRHAPLYASTWSAPSPSTAAGPTFCNPQIRHASTNPNVPSSSSSAPAAPGPRGARPFNISGLFSFRPRRAPSLNIGNARSEFLSRAERGELDRMASAYELALTSARSTSVSGYTAKDGGELLLSREDLLVGMRALAYAKDAQAAVGVLLKMVEEAQNVFGYEVGEEEWTAAVVCLFRAGRMREAMEKIRELRHQGGDGVDLSEVLRLVTREAHPFTNEIWGMMSPTEDDWVEYFGYLRRASEEGRHNVWARIPAATKNAPEWSRPGGPRATIARLRALLAFGNIETVTKAYTTMMEQRRTTTPDGQSETRPLKDVLGSYDEWKLELEYAHYVGTSQQLMAVCKEMLDTGHEIPQTALRWLVLDRLRDGEGLEEAVSVVEGELACAISSKTFSWIMWDGSRLVIPEEDLSHAERSRRLVEWCVQVYRVARGRGVEIDWYITRAMTTQIASASPEALDACFEAYADALRNDDGIPTPSRHTLVTRVFQDLTGACAKSDPPRALAARDVIKQAAAMGIQNTAHRPDLVRLIQSAPDHDVAYEIYVYYHRVNAVDEELFNRIINCIISLAPRDSEFILPPADLLLEIVKNMKITGIEPGAHVFTSLVTRYGRLASQRQDVPPDEYSRRRVALQIAVGDIHNRIKLDSGITVDLPLLNALMDAYNRTGQPETALTIWNDLVDRRARTDPAVAKSQYPISVSIAMDLCSHHGMEARLRRVWAWARRHGFAETPKTWNGYVEALCRLGRLGEAADVVLRQMKERVDGAPAPEVETVKILLKFRRQAGEEKEAIKAAVKSELPELWEQVKDALGNQEKRAR